MRDDIVALDLETTGLDITTDAIIEIGAVRLRDGVIVGEYSTLVNPGLVITAETSRITGIYPDDLRQAPSLKQVLPQLIDFAGNDIIVAHNVAFDMGFMRRHSAMRDNLTLDTIEIASILVPRAPRYNLGALTQFFGIELEHAHRALDDARATALLYWHLWQKALGLPPSLIQDILNLSHSFHWDLRIFFEACQQSQPSQMASNAESGSRPITLAQEQDEQVSNDITDSAPTETPQPIDTEQLNHLLGPEGALAQSNAQYEARDAQRVMAKAIAESFNNAQHLLIEAGTGTGKSIAYLLPALLWSHQNKTRIVISTNTINLQEQLIRKDIPSLLDLLDWNLKASVMKGRNNYLCPRRLDSLKRRLPVSLDELRTLIKIMIWIYESPEGDRNEISLRGNELFTWNRLSAQDEGCTMHRCATVMRGACPFHQARQQAEKAHILVVNHALLISDALSDNRVLPDYDYLVIDEAHQLEDAITDGLSLRLDQITLVRRLTELGGPETGMLADLLASMRNKIPDKLFLRLETYIQFTGEAIGAMRAQVVQLFDRIVQFVHDIRAEESGQIRLTPRLRQQNVFASVQSAWHRLDEFFEALVEAMSQLSVALSRIEEYAVDYYDDHINSVRATVRYLTEARHALNEFSDQPDSNRVYWISTAQNKEYYAVNIAPVHIGELVETQLWQRKRSIILTSATLQSNQSFDYVRDRLYADRIQSISLDSPFNYKDSTLLYVPDDIPEPNQNGYQRAVERGIIELAAALEGRVMVLFTSYTQLRETASNIAPRLALGNITVYDQVTGTSRDALLDNFRTTDKAVLLGTRSFWEGIDIPGSDLSAVVIVRLPFAVPTDPVFAARSERYQEPFLEFAVPDAILRFRQGFGRLIRTRNDRGIVTIFDSRIINKRYGRQFLDALPDCTVQISSLEGLAKAAKDWLAE